MSDKTLVERLREEAKTAREERGLPVYTPEKIEKLADAIEREYLPRPRFEDGEVVEVGDMVLWNSEKAKRVQDIKVEVHLEGSCGTDNSVLKRPIDTLERIEEDTGKGVCDYFAEQDGVPCDDCRGVFYNDCRQHMMLDLLRRQRAVLERGLVGETTGTSITFTNYACPV